ncbi:hypothetical protein pb186bvf_019106 [Paramecium bursaria]
MNDTQTIEYIIISQLLWNKKIFQFYNLQSKQNNEDSSFLKKIINLDEQDFHHSIQKQETVSTTQQLTIILTNYQEISLFDQKYEFQEIINFTNIQELLFVKYKGMMKMQDLTKQMNPQYTDAYCFKGYQLLFRSMNFPQQNNMRRLSFCLIKIKLNAQRMLIIIRVINTTMIQEFLYVNKKYSEAAIQIYDQAIQLNPAYLEAYQNKGYTIQLQFKNLLYRIDKNESYTIGWINLKAFYLKGSKYIYNYGSIFTNLVQNDDSMIKPQNLVHLNQIFIIIKVNSITLMQVFSEQNEKVERSNINI